MQRLAFRRPSWLPCRRFYCTPSPSNEPLSVTHVWSLWNEGNLFSLSTAQLTQFLSSEKVEVDPRWKKAALVRQVEELLQNKGSKASPNQGAGKKPASPSQDAYNESWDKPVKSETLLDLSQAGFYEGGGHMAPRAFQMLVADAAPDLVVSRVNTTAFPGFPANCECYTLTGADAEQSTRTRYSKALQWCVMNLRNIGLDGEVQVEFGKMLIAKEVLVKNKKVVSAWTLQQRLQTLNPHSWVSVVSAKGAADVEKLLSANKYTLQGKSNRSYYVLIRRAKDEVVVEMNASGAVTNVAKPYDDLQSSHFLRENGPDIRLSLRSRPIIKKADADTFMKAKIMKVNTDPVEITLPSELGEVVYASENEERVWQKKLDIGVNVTVIERQRQPLVVTKDSEDGERFEYEIRVGVPAPNERVDLNAFANEVFDLSRAISDAAANSFVADFGTTSTTPSTATE